MINLRQHLSETQPLAFFYHSILKYLSTISTVHWASKDRDSRNLKVPKSLTNHLAQLILEGSKYNRYSKKKKHSLLSVGTWFPTLVTLALPLMTWEPLIPCQRQAKCPLWSFAAETHPDLAFEIFPLQRKGGTCKNQLIEGDSSRGLSRALHLSFPLNSVLTLRSLSRSESQEYPAHTIPLHQTLFIEDTEAEQYVK